MYVCKHVCMSACMCVCMYIYVCMHDAEVCVYMYTHLQQRQQGTLKETVHAVGADPNHCTDEWSFHIGRDIDTICKTKT